MLHGRCALARILCGAPLRVINTVCSFPLAEANGYVSLAVAGSIRHPENESSIIVIVHHQRRDEKALAHSLISIGSAPGGGYLAVTTLGAGAAACMLYARAGAQQRNISAAHVHLTFARRRCRRRDAGRFFLYLRRAATHATFLLLPFYLPSWA